MQYFCRKKMVTLRKPEWLKTKINSNGEYSRLLGIIKNNELHTICESGSCPNKSECWCNGVATFMILGNICTRSCKFCNVQTGKPYPPDPNEPEMIMRSVRLMNLKHIVITSVDRDDLPDFGASAWVEVIKALKENIPNLKIETLIPDFQGNTEFIEMVINSGPDVISHNLETVERLTPIIRSKAQYKTSLEVINFISRGNVISKSGIMLGLGETKDEVLKTMDDLLNVGCQIITIGQYLQPTKKHYPVKEYVSPEMFYYYKEIGLSKGFKIVESAPLVRSSYHADKQIT